VACGVNGSEVAEAVVVAGFDVVDLGGSGSVAEVADAGVSSEDGAA